MDYLIGGELLWCVFVWYIYEWIVCEVSDGVVFLERGELWSLDISLLDTVVSESTIKLVGQLGFVA